MNYIDDLRANFYSGKTLDYNFRIDALKKLKHSLFVYKDKLKDAFFQDLNKCEFDFISCEFSMVIGEINYFLKHLKKLMAPHKVSTSIVNFPSHGIIYPEPYGVCLIMAPWNYPLQLALSPLVASIATGNVSVVKPSNYCPNVSNVIKKLLSVFDDNYIYVVLGGRDKNTELLEQRFDFIFFTGGDKVGRLVMEKASHNLTPVVLELGGKSPVIVCKDTDIDMAAKRITWGKYLNAGQTCVAPDHIYVHEDIKDKFIDKVKHYINEFYYVDGKITPDFTHIINEKHVERLKGLINQSKVVFGGNIDGRLIEPTVMDNVNYDDAIMGEEIFGPIMPILPFNDIDKVIDHIKKDEKPLALYLFTFDKDIQNKVMNNCSFGGGCINDCIMHLTNEKLPFGGVGRSGMGSYHGKKSFETFSHEKSVLIKNKTEINLKYPPYTDKKLKTVKAFTKSNKE